MTDAPRTTLERERKLAVPPGFELPPLTGTPLEPRTFTSTYLDTPDRRLARVGITLRRRTERGTGAWQLKLPSGRDRLELESPGGRTPPEALTSLLRGLLRDRELEPAAVLRTHRRGIRAHSGRVQVAEVVHDRVAIMDGRRIADRFEEVEIEAIDGDEPALNGLQATLVLAGAEPTDGTPKAFRVLAVPERPWAPLSPDAELVRGALERNADELARRDPGTRLGRDPEDLHQLRVATRRLRAVLRVARPMLDPDWADGLRAELAWLGTALGPVRDLDVLLEHFTEELARLDESDRAAAAPLLERLAAERETAQAALLEALSDPRYFRLLDALEDAAAAPRFVKGETSIVKLASTEFSRLEKAARALSPDISDGDLHAIRVRGKRARYATELAAPLLGANSAAVISRAKRFQDVIGEHQDAVVAEERLRKLTAKLDDPRAAFAAGLLVECQRERRRTARAAVPAAWRRLAKAGRKVWPR
jgi:CHAD domain-containing protein